MTLKVILTDKYKEVNDTRIFDTLKARVTVPQAAAHYGVRIGRNGMCRCPFHPDKTPSMKINETYFYCFGCHSTGDVIDFTAKLFNLSPLEAARKLAADFGIDPNTPVFAAVALPCIRQEESRREQEGQTLPTERRLMRMTKRLRPDQFPPWYDGQSINEAAFCREFLASHKLLYTENSFFAPEGRMADEAPLKTEIYQIIEPYASTSVPKKISNIIELLKITAHIDDFPPQTDRIHVANGTLFLDGSFSTAKDRIVRSRFPVAYNPSAPRPETWLRFLSGLLYEDDIPTLQEYIGYCLIPSNKGQRMMVIKGNGGESKSQIGTVLSHLFGCNAKDGSVGKVSENRFARADLEHVHLLIDDDMRMEALRQTNYVKSLVTVQGRMDLEKKGKQSYQGWMFARLLAFSNGDLQSLYDRSNGFYRRQLILTTRERPPDQVDDPDIAEKMCRELEGIFLWAFEGLQRLVANHFRFTESVRAHANRETIRQDANNVLLFMEAGDYIRLTPEGKVGSQELYEIYTVWCRENCFSPLKNRSFSGFLIANQKKYHIEHSNNLTNLVGRRVWGFTGIEPILKLPLRTADGWQRDFSDDNPFI